MLHIHEDNMYLIVPILSVIIDIEYKIEEDVKECSKQGI
jgi:hypothetical protein